MSILQNQLEGLVLAKLYEQTRSHSGRLTLQGLTHALDGSVTAARVELALGALMIAGYVEDDSGWYNESQTQYWLTDAGYKKAEYVAEFGDEQEDQAIIEIEKALAPASDRIVSFGDNEEARQDLDGSIAKIEDIVKSSNSIEPDIGQDVENGLSAWRVMMKDAKTFAVRAFRTLVWERLKKAISSSIEDAFKLVLKGLLITIGTIIASLIAGGL